ncbi:hypothetical protein M422DRAFT_169238 [Sphaerobolus stellatus SS14]|uniref:MPN domain-containing protein n=1 Tax=Sphaerobolus stellatus (strain SS14) TaxID=990650 RepID=A0A0C9VZA9_SPHS4|nr:hypothetical protein M422DRAFT_169238 [Sphaerobolus stellatus SS14]
MQNGISRPPRPPSPGSRILSADQIKSDDADTVFKKTELKVTHVPDDLTTRFLSIASLNTDKHKETCGLLLGKKGRLQDVDIYKVTDLVIPKQRSASDSCLMVEDEVTVYGEERNLITLGWIHTHPHSSCFMTSSDMHILANFQRHLPEFFAIICSPNHYPETGVFRLTDPPGLKRVMTCKDTDPLHSHKHQLPLYTDADKGHIVFVSETLPTIADLR